jgi:hypothetical protein
MIMFGEQVLVNRTCDLLLFKLLFGEDVDPRPSPKEKAQELCDKEHTGSTLRAISWLLLVISGFCPGVIHGDT